jgi:hypothetical protein
MVLPYQPLAKSGHGLLIVLCARDRFTVPRRMQPYTTLAPRDAIVKSSHPGPCPIKSCEVSEDSEASDSLIPSYG